MKAYLLVAGYATRLHPLTLDRPKALLEIGGRPLLSYILDRLCELEGIREIVVVGNHRFAEAFDRWIESVDCPVPIHRLDDGSMSDDDKLGAIGDLAFALDAHPPAEGEAILALAGDNWLGFDLRLAQAHFEAAGRETTLMLRELAEIPDGPSPYNEVTLGETGRVVRFREKPVDPQTKWAAIALYFFPPTIAEAVTRYLAGGGNPDAPGYFIEWWTAKAPVHAVEIDGEWMDIGNRETLEAARRRFG